MDRPMTPIAPINYIIRHWRGQLSLAISFWANVFAIDILFILIANFFINPSALSALAGIYFIVFIWQLVGCWRSAKKHMETTMHPFWARAVKMVLIVEVIYMLFYLLVFAVTALTHSQHFPINQEKNLQEIKQQ